MAWLILFVGVVAVGVVASVRPEGVPELPGRDLPSHLEPDSGLDRNRGPQGQSPAGD